MSDLIAEFCREHQAYNDLSSERRKMQTRVLHRFAERVEDFEQLTARDLQQFLGAEVESGFAPTTVAKHLHAISPFLRWLNQRGMIDSGRMWELKQVRPPRGSNGGRPRPYSQRELTTFWKALDYAYPPADQPEKWLRRFEKGSSHYPRIQAHAKRTQMEAIIALALFGGLRRNEIFGSTLEELHPENAYIVVRSAAKNPEAQERARIVPWNDPLWNAVNGWFELRERLAPGHDSTWLSLHQNHYRKPMWRRTFGELLRLIGRGYEYHRMRHTFATEALRAGMPIEILQRVLGHSRLQQTLVYAELVEGDVLREARKVEQTFTNAIERTRHARDAA